MERLHRRRSLYMGTSRRTRVPRTHPRLSRSPPRQARPSRAHFHSHTLGLREIALERGVLLRPVPRHTPSDDLLRPSTPSHDLLLHLTTLCFPFTPTISPSPPTNSAFRLHHPRFTPFTTSKTFETPPRLPQTPPASSATFHYLSPSLRANSRRIRRIIEL